MIDKRKTVPDQPPVFKEIFGTSWAKLPPVFRDHYANRKNRADTVRTTGKMTIWQSPLIRPFAMLFRATGTLVPVTENNVETEVIFRTQPNSPCFWFHRTFTLNDKTRYQFTSRLEPLGGNHVIEWTSARIGWHSTFSFDGTRVLLHHVGYRLRLGRRNLPLPMAWLFGKPSAWERAIDDQHFQMEMSIQHPLFGKLYSYAGTFEITGVCLAK